MFSSHFHRHLLRKLSLVYLLAIIVIIEGLTEDQYIGCFYDNSSQLLQWTGSISDSSMTIELCIKHCQAPGTKTYARLQNGTVCECGDDYGVQLSDSLCNLPCAGNQSEYCGGAKNGLKTIYSVYAVCPIGNYGAPCDRVCHCKRQIPCDRTTGKCPNECDRNYTGADCNTAIPTNYIGCFRDIVEDRALPIQVHALDYSIITIKVCIGWCSEIFSTFAGPQDGSQCFCGESYDRYGPLNETSCNKRCGGNRSEFCGGANANGVYSVCLVGNYGKGCSRRCNCLKDGRCAYLTGSCFSSLCKPGWRGTSCNSRDCASLNGDCCANETCLSVDLKFTNFNVCRCSDGFQRDKIFQNCTDIDECAKTPSVCGEGAVNCTNTVGGYRCYCKNDHTTYKEPCALDVDECSRTPSICGAEAVNCSNTYGSYICYCTNGDTIRNGTCILMASVTNGGKTAIIIGAVVGSICGLLVIVAIFVAVVCYRRKRCETPPAEVSSSQLNVKGTEPELQYSSLVQTSDQPNMVYEKLNVDTYEEVDIQAQPES